MCVEGTKENLKGSKQNNEMHANSIEYKLIGDSKTSILAFLDASPAPRDPKSADFSSFYLEFLVFSLSFEFFLEF